MKFNLIPKDSLQEDSHVVILNNGCLKQVPIQQFIEYICALCNSTQDFCLTYSSNSLCPENGTFYGTSDNGILSSNQISYTNLTYFLLPCKDASGYSIEPYLDDLTQFQTLLTSSANPTHYAILNFTKINPSTIDLEAVIGTQEPCAENACDCYLLYQVEVVSSNGTLNNQEKYCFRLIGAEQQISFATLGQGETVYNSIINGVHIIRNLSSTVSVIAGLQEDGALKLEVNKNWLNSQIQIYLENNICNLILSNCTSSITPNLKWSDNTTTPKTCELTNSNPCQESVIANLTGFIQKSNNNGNTWVTITAIALNTPTLLNQEVPGSYLYRLVDDAGNISNSLTYNVIDFQDFTIRWNDNTTTPKTCNNNLSTCSEIIVSPVAGTLQRSSDDGANWSNLTTETQEFAHLITETNINTYLYRVVDTNNNISNILEYTLKQKQQNQLILKLDTFPSNCCVPNPTCSFIFKFTITNNNTDLTATQAQMRYKLKTDINWITLPVNLDNPVTPEFSISDIGEYDFEVRAQDQNGDWTNWTPNASNPTGFTISSNCNIKGQTFKIEIAEAQCGNSGNDIDVSTLNPLTLQTNQPLIENGIILNPISLDNNAVFNGQNKTYRQILRNPTTLIQSTFQVNENGVVFNLQPCL